MKKLTVILIFFSLFNWNCYKDSNNEVCGCDRMGRTEEVKDIFGIGVETDDGFEILTDEKGLLVPCSSIPENLKVDFQPVTISGKLKTACKEIDQGFKITPIQVSDIKSRSANYDKKDITLTIIKSENYGYSAGFGFFMEDLRTPHGTRVLQPTIPAIGGLKTFATPVQATKTGILFVYLARGRSVSIGREILDYINVIN
jgi:hypothetical protein